MNTVNIAAREEIFGPVLSTLVYREQREAIALANNTTYGLAATIWSDNINRALDVAPQLKAGVVWVNTSNRFDASCGFGGYKESGMGREGGKEGMLDYMKPVDGLATDAPSYDTANASDTGAAIGITGVNQTAKLYIGGKQKRSDNENTLTVNNAAGNAIGRVPEGNRKDIRNAVEAAAKAAGWASGTQHTKAQILYYLAENLSYRKQEFCSRLQQSVGYGAADAEAEFDASINLIFTYAAWCDKYEGAVHSPPMRGVTLAMNEAVGVIGICAPDDSPLLSLLGLMLPAVAMGNTVVTVPSQTAPLVATDLYQVFETSDIPAGVINIVTGNRDELAKVMAEHMQVDSIWYHGSEAGCAIVEKASVANLKRTWVNQGQHWDWFKTGQERQFLQQATEVKNIWIPYGD
jgi:aldehyde dehydrogenase (NAD+)